jgi:glycosyltransferase involved in cell wall biosynthesis
MISIVTGTLNRGPFLQGLIENTVEANEKLELVLVDGGSTDGSIEYIKDENHPRIKLIEVGQRSSYPHFMNLGIQNASHEIICQWNDDVLLTNDWEEVFSEVDDDHDFYLFNWKYGTPDDIKTSEWLSGNDHSNDWFLTNEKPDGEIVMNYGLYKKKIFREIGMYNNQYRYYCADGDMADRAYSFGYKVKTLRNIKVCSLITDKVAQYYVDDAEIYHKNLELYKQKVLPDTIEFLQ